jgi:hypothetical protein
VEEPKGREPISLDVIAGLDPAIHGEACANGSMDARVKPAHDNLQLPLCVSVPLW